MGKEHQDKKQRLIEFPFENSDDDRDDEEVLGGS
jgi:hypothetical protein